MCQFSFRKVKGQDKHQGQVCAVQRIASQTAAHPVGTEPAYFLVLKTIIFRQCIYRGTLHGQRTYMPTFLCLDLVVFDEHQIAWSVGHERRDCQRYDGRNRLQQDQIRPQRRRTCDIIVVIVIIIIITKMNVVLTVYHFITEWSVGPFH